MDVSDLSLLCCAKVCLSLDVIVARCLLSRSLLAASLTSFCCGVSVLLIWYNSLLLLLSLSSRPIYVPVAYRCSDYKHRLYAYNRNIDKRLARKLIWLRETIHSIRPTTKQYHACVRLWAVRTFKFASFMKHHM